MLGPVPSTGDTATYKAQSRGSLSSMQRQTSSSPSPWHNAGHVELMMTAYICRLPFGRMHSISLWCSEKEIISLWLPQGHAKQSLSDHQTQTTKTRLQFHRLVLYNLTPPYLSGLISCTSCFAHDAPASKMLYSSMRRDGRMCQNCLPLAVHRGASLSSFRS